MPVLLQFGGVFSDFLTVMVDRKKRECSQDPRAA